MAYTTNWRSVEPVIGVQGIQDASDSLNQPLGTIVRAKDFGPNGNGEGEFIYLKGNTGVAVGTWVTYNTDDGSVALLAADAIGPVAISMSANTSTSNYSWYQISGKAVGKVLAGFADNADVYTTATPGSVDDAVVATERVKRAKGASAIDGPATGMAEFELDRPFVDNGVAA